MMVPRSDQIAALFALVFVPHLSHNQEPQPQKDNGVFFSGLPRLPPGLNAIPSRNFTRPSFSKFANQFSTSKPDLNKQTTPFDFKFNSERPDGRLITPRREILSTSTQNPFNNKPSQPATTAPPRSTTRNVPTTTLRTTTIRTTTTTTRPTTLRLTTRSTPLTIPFFVRTVPAQTPTTPKPRPPQQRAPSTSFPRFSFVDTKRGTVRPALPIRSSSPPPFPTRFTITTTRLTTVQLPKSTTRSVIQPVPTTPLPKVGLAFCDPTRCQDSCKEKFGKRLTSATCFTGDCRCEFTEDCRPEMCMRLCRERNPDKVVLNALCKQNNCECTFKPVCRFIECRDTCQKTFGSRFIDADCVDNEVCKCSHS